MSMRISPQDPQPTGVGGAKVTISESGTIPDSNVSLHPEMAAPPGRQQQQIQTPVPWLIYFLGMGYCLIYTAYGGMGNSMINISDIDVQTFVQQTKGDVAKVATEAMDPQKNQDINTNELANWYEFAVGMNHLIHACVAFCVPYLANRVGQNWLLAVGACGYVVAVTGPLASYYTNWEPCYFFYASLFKGCMAPIFWTAYGVFKANIADVTNQGSSDGVFYALFNCSALINNALWIYFVSNRWSMESQLWCWEVIAFVAFLCILMVAYTAQYVYNVREVEKDSEISFSESLSRVSKCFTEFDKFQIMYVDFVTGIVKGWLFGDISKYLGKDLGWKWAPMLQLFLGSTSLFGGIVAGMLFDLSTNKSKILRLGLSGITVGIALFIGASFIGHEQWSQEKVKTENDTVLIICYMAGLCAAFGFPLIDVSISAIVGIKYPTETEFMYSSMEISFSMGCCLSLVLGSYVELLNTYFPTLERIGPSKNLSLITSLICLFVSLSAFAVLDAANDIVVHPSMVSSASTSAPAHSAKESPTAFPRSDPYSTNRINTRAQGIPNSYSSKNVRDVRISGSPEANQHKM